MLRRIGANDQLLYLQTYQNWIIAYDFNFTITENNDAAGVASFKLPLTNGTFTLGVDVGNKRGRETTRSFKMADAFQDFRDPRFQRKCSNKKQYANLIYPVTGRIGLAESMETFFALDVGKLTANSCDWPTVTVTAPCALLSETR